MSQFGIPQSGGMVNFQPPMHNPFAGVGGLLANPMMQLATAMFMPQMIGQNNFMPTLTPSQHLFDQYEAFKYQNARMEGAKGPRGIDQQVLAGNLLGHGAALFGHPMTAMNAVQAGNIAGMLNNPFVSSLVAGALGPETMEDLFYGSRGSAEMLYNSVASTGFHQRDPATGGQRMTAASMSGMASEMYAQMYGPNADLSEMNGISAGRAGTLYRDLAQRGLLPQSLGNLSASDRVKAIAENLPTDSDTLDRLARDYGHRDMLKSDQKLVDGKTYAELTPEQQRAQVDQRLGGDGGYKDRINRDFADIRAYNDGVAGRKSIGEIEQLEGFSGAARSIDASKVSNKLKEYSGAIAAVREIFGANGSPNAPMNQLINGLEALTQGSMSSMSPAKMETFVRKMQMSSRDSGIGLQAMLGISSQLGAFGDTLGLDRSFAAQNTLQAMDTVTAMRDAGNFNRGFGSMSQEQAAMSAGYLAQAGDASAVGNTLGAAARIVAENPDAHIGPDGKPKTELGAMVEAYNKGETTYIDPATGKQVDLAKRVGEGGTGAVREIMKGSGVNSGVADAIVGDVQGNQEFINAGMAARLGQRSGVEAEIGMQVGGQLRSLNRNAGDAYATEFGKQMAGTLIDDMRGIPASERITVLKDRAMEVMRKMERDADPRATDAEIEARAAQKFSASFGSSDDEVRQNMQGMLAASNRVLAAKGAPARLTANNIRDMMATSVLENRDRIDARHARRAELMQAFGGTQSTFLQRYADVMHKLGAGDEVTAGAAMQAVLGVIPKDRITEAMTPGVEAAITVAAEASREGMVTTQEEINSLRRKAASKDPQTAAAAVKKLREYAGPGSDKIDDLDKLANAANQRSGDILSSGGGKAIARSRRILQGINDGGTAGVAMSAQAFAEQMLGDDASKESVIALAEAFKTGDQEKIAALLPQLADSDKQTTRDGHVKDFVRLLDELQTGARGVGNNNAHAIAEARQNTMKEIITEDNKKMLALSVEGRKMIGMAEAAPDGTYTYSDENGKEVSGNIYQELNAVGSDADDSFTTFLDNATSELNEEQRAEAQKKIDGIKDAMNQGGGLGDIGKLLGGAGGLGDIFKGIIAAFEKALGGGISSATITIDSLQNLTVQNATGTPAGAARDAVGAGTEGARVAQQREQRLDAAAEEFNAAQSELGAIAQKAGLPLADVLEDSSKLPEDLRAPADAARERGVKAAKTINDSQEQRDSVRTAASAVPEAATELQTAANELAALEKKQAEQYAGLSPTEQQEFKRYQAIEKAKAVLADPKATASQSRAAAHTLNRAANDGAAGGDGLSNKSRDYARGEIELQRKKEQVEDLRKADRDKYDRKALGVTEQVTPEQKAIIDRVSTDPTGKKFTSEMSGMFNGHIRQAMFTLPDDAAIDLFSKFDPEAQKKGLEQLAAARTNPLLPEDQQKNAARLYDAISADMAKKEKKDTGGQKDDKQAQQTAAVSDAQTSARSHKEEIEEAAKVVAQRDRAKTDAAEKGRQNVDARVDKGAEKQTKQQETIQKIQLLADGRNGMVFDDDGRTMWGHVSTLNAFGDAGAAFFDALYAEETEDGKQRYIGRSGDSFYERYEVPGVGTQYRSVELTPTQRAQIDKADEENIERVRQAEEKQRESRQAQDGQRDDAAKDKKHTEKKQEKTDDRQQDKKREVADIVPRVDEKREQQQKEEFMSQAKQAAMAESQRNIQHVANNTGGGDGEKEITGTLQLKGLTEAFLAASPKQMEPTDDNGPRVDTGNATKAYVGGNA